MSEMDELRGAPHKRLVVLSFFLTLLVDFIPLPAPLAYFLPEATAIVLIYWLLHRPQFIGIGAAFILGLLMDVGTNAPLGQHALAYICMAFLIDHKRRRIILYPFGLQAVAVSLALLVCQSVLLLVSLFQQQEISWWRLLLPPVLAGLLWPLLNKLMLALAHYRRSRP